MTDAGKQESKGELAAIGAKSLMPLSEKDRALVEAVDRVIEEGGLTTLSGGNGISAGIRMANAMQLVRESLTPEVMAQVMKLQGSALGFVTDRDHEGGKYDVGTVADCVVEAIIRGARIHGNEFNIIASRPYLTKNFFTRALQQMDGLTDLSLTFAVPVKSQDCKEAKVACYASWKLNGKPMSLSCDYKKEGESIFDSRIPVRVNSRMGDDAILGKAERKLKKRVFDRITGSTHSEADLDDAIDVVAEPVVQPGSTTIQTEAAVDATVHPETKSPSQTLADAAAKTTKPKGGKTIAEVIEWAKYGPKDTPDKYVGRLCAAIDKAPSEEAVNELGKAVGEAVGNGHINDSDANTVFDAVERRLGNLS